MTTNATSGQKVRRVTRDHIVEVSRAIVEDDGVEQLTIRRIAETIGRTQPAVYQHFTGKDAILAAVVTEGFIALVERLTPASKGEAPLTAIANAYVRFGLERPRLYEVMFVGPPAIAFAAGDATPMPARAAFHILAAAVAESGLEPATVETATEVVWAALHGLVMLSITKRLRPGRVLQRSRLERLTTAIGAMTAHT